MILSLSFPRAVTVERQPNARSLSENCGSNLLMSGNLGTLGIDNDSPAFSLLTSSPQTVFFSPHASSFLIEEVSMMLDHALIVVSPMSLLHVSVALPA